jgi:hypothetical protein
MTSVILLMNLAITKEMRNWASRRELKKRYEGTKRISKRLLKM